MKAVRLVEIFPVQEALGWIVRAMWSGGERNVGKKMR